MGDGMEREERREYERKERVRLYKNFIVYGYLTIAILTVIMSIFLVYKVKRMEQKLDRVINEENSLNLLSKAERQQDSDSDTAGVVGHNSVQSVLGQAAVNDEEIPKRVYLTFDDGPSDYTDEILDILAANDVKATFFVIGHDEEYYDAYRRIVEEGHTIGLHSYSHVYEDFYQSVDSFAMELTRLNELLYDVTGTGSSIFRFPGGSSNSVCPLPVQNYIAYLNENGIRYYDWNSLSGDAVTTGLSPWQLVNNIMKDVRNNQDSIVLMHDLNTTHATVESLQLLIDTLREEGYEILPIDQETPLIQHVSYQSAEE